jgi:hypothetical protein
MYEKKIALEMFRQRLKLLQMSQDILSNLNDADNDDARLAAEGNKPRKRKSE